MQKLLILILVATCMTICSASAEDAGHPRLLLTADDVRANAKTWRQSPHFSSSVAHTRDRTDRYFETLPDVPVPRDAGGGYTHETHKRNAVAIYEAGMLYQWTGEDRYASNAGALLLAYAALYPSLDEHPEKKEQSPGKLFWQSLNEAVWLVYTIQGYDAVLEALPAADRKIIESGLLRPMVRFLSVESPQTFNKVHNHGTWATAAVGMTGYVLDDAQYVSQALLGLDLDGSGGFLKQLDVLFSPDGYYNEGPYYQRYALMPFVLFAKSIEQNEPQRKIFQYRDGIVKKAIYTAIQLSYAGKFFPLNDAIKDKGLDTIELDYAIPVAYGITGDKTLLSLIGEDSKLVLTGDALKFAVAKEAGEAAPFAYASMQLRDGSDGKDGALTILRDGAAAGAAALVFKATSQGMGHGHFDRLNWLYFDNGSEVISDYGAARFLNVVQKNGGHYLPENNTWAKQTVAHNALVVDERSHFDGKLKLAEKTAPTPVYYHSDAQSQVVSAREDHAYPGVTFSRTMLMLHLPQFTSPLIVDVLKVSSKASHQFDLPVYYQGQLVDASSPVNAATLKLEAAGRHNGYQHLWLRGQATANAGETFALTWLLGNRFYTHTTLADRDITVLLTETGAGDPDFNLRHEPGLLLRTGQEAGVTYVNVLETHGEYNGSREFTLDSASRIRAMQRIEADGSDLIDIETTSGQRIVVALSHDPDPKARHVIETTSGTYEWPGFYRVFLPSGVSE